MKKILIYLLVLMMALTVVSCGAKQKVEEAIGEKIIEEMSGNTVDVSGDTVKIKGEDGSQVTFGATEWPKSDLVKNIPQFKDGSIVSVMDSEGYSMIIIEEVSENEFTGYYDEIKKNFTKDSYEMNADGVISFGAGNGKGISVQISYEKEKETLSIVTAKTE